MRSLLYCSSDSDEIESLVFNQAADYCFDESEEQAREVCESLFKMEDFSDQTTFGFASEDSWSTSNSQKLATAFECDISLLHLDVATD